MRRPFVWVLGLGLAAAGCGGPTNQPPTPTEMGQTALSDVGELYRLYTVEKNKPPARVADFAPMEMMSPTGLRAIKSGEVVVRLGAALPDTGEEPGKGPGDEVLAYQKEVPESGGQVLMLNRTIRTMTPEEFKAAKLAGNGSSASEPAPGKKAK